MIRHGSLIVRILYIFRFIVRDTDIPESIVYLLAPDGTWTPSVETKWEVEHMPAIRFWFLFVFVHLLTDIFVLGPSTSLTASASGVNTASRPRPPPCSTRLARHSRARLGIRSSLVSESTMTRARLRSTWLYRCLATSLPLCYTTTCLPRPI